MLGCLGHDMTISLISPIHQPTSMTCMHKCNSHVKLIQSNVSLSLFLFPAQPFPMSQLDYSSCVGFLIQDSLHFVQSTGSCINLDLDCLLFVLLSVGTRDFNFHKNFQN